MTDFDEDRGQRIRDAKDRELARGQQIGWQPLADAFITGVVGVSFVPSYPANIHALDLLWFDAQAAGENLTAIINRNPDNTYDSNACEVHVPALGDPELAFIGHLNKVIAARLAPELDRGATWQAEVVGVRINPDHPDRPGLDVKLTRRN